MQIVKVCAIGAAVAMAAPLASAATVSIESVTGSWVSTSQNNAFGVNIDNSSTSSKVSWGQPPVNAPQSSYVFDQVIPPPVEVDPFESFVLGKFTHNNWPIYTMPSNGQATAIEWAELAVEFVVKINDTVYDFTRTYRFDHDETPNNAVNGSCTYGAASDDVNGNGCADRVTATVNAGASESLTVDGLLYTFDISGFQVDGTTFDFFLTKEKSINEATLVGTYFVESADEPDPEPSPVPLPAAGWMLIAGVGGLAAIKRRNSRKKA